MSYRQGNCPRKTHEGFGLVATSPFPINRTTASETPADNASLLMPDPQIESAQFSTLIFFSAALSFPKEIGAVIVTESPECYRLTSSAPHASGVHANQSSPISGSSFSPPSCTTVTSTWTRSRPGCLRPTQERTQYPIVHHKDVHGELWRSIFP